MLIVPVLMLLLVVAVQVALWAHAAQVAQLAASEGDRVARSFGEARQQARRRPGPCSGRPALT